MAPIYRKALVIGATSGIGEALAARLVLNGTGVVAVGRRKDRLDAFVAEHQGAAGTASAVEFDITDLAGIPAFATAILSQHPDLDCVVLNSGIQRPFDFSTPGSVDLSGFGQELTTNYTAYVHLVTAFLPHLQKASSEGGQTVHMVFISATLGLVPSLLRTPGYCASKAALHSFIMVLRQQMVDAGYTRLRIVEVFPPAVQTELHDEKHQPDLVNGWEIGIPLATFTDELYGELEKGTDDYIAIGPGAGWLRDGGFENERQKLFQQQHGVVKTALSKYLRA